MNTHDRVEKRERFESGFLCESLGKILEKKTFVKYALKRHHHLAKFSPREFSFVDHDECEEERATAALFRGIS